MQTTKYLVLLLFIPFIAFNTACSPGYVRVEHINNITIEDLGALPGGNHSTAWDINDGGYIVGSSATTSSGNRRAFVIHGQGMQSLGTLPGGGTSQAFGISNNGYIVGSAINSSGKLHAFVNRYNTMKDMGAFPPEDSIGSSSIAFAANNTPLIAGKVDLAGVVWNLNGIPNFPPYPPSILVTAPGNFTPAITYDINNNGQAAGTLLAEAIGFRWTQGGGIERLSTLGPADDDAYGINTHGHVVGQALLAPPVRYHAVLWTTPSTIHDLGTLGGDNSAARDINNSGTVVGHSEDASGHTQAFIWRRSLGMKSLGTLGGNNSEAYAINSEGVIVGKSEDSEGRTRATRWKVSIGETVIDLEPAPSYGGDFFNAE